MIVPKFEKTVAALTVVNCALLGVSHYRQPDWADATLTYLNFAFNCLWLLEDAPTARWRFVNLARAHNAACAAPHSSKREVGSHTAYSTPPD